MMTVILVAAVTALMIALSASAVGAMRSSFRAGYWTGVERTSKAYDLPGGVAAIIERVGPPPEPPI